MQQVQLGSSDLLSSPIAYGCMRLAEYADTSNFKVAEKAILSALEVGINHFDHADIYANGESERLFAKILKANPLLRDNLIITSKCGIRNKSSSQIKHYDLSKKYILMSVDGSLSRLNSEHLDVLLLHRPDFLMHTDEVVDAFDELLTSGKVRNFGVSNFPPHLVDLLNSQLNQQLIINQIEINIHNIDAFIDGTLSQCQQLNLTPMAWCPLAQVAYPPWNNTFTSKTQDRLKIELQHQSQHYNQPPWIIILAWLLKHPANIMPIIGTKNTERIQIINQAIDLNYQHQHWYRLLEARNGVEVD